MDDFIKLGIIILIAVVLGIIWRYRFSSSNLKVIYRRLKKKDLNEEWLSTMIAKEKANGRKQQREVR